MSNTTPPSLPSKVYEVRGEVVLLHDLLQAGVVEIKGGDGSLVYCFFQVILEPLRLRSDRIDIRRGTCLGTAD